MPMRGYFNLSKRAFYLNAQGDSTALVDGSAKIAAAANFMYNTLERIARGQSDHGHGPDVMAAACLASLQENLGIGPDPDPDPKQARLRLVGGTDGGARL